MAETQSKTTTLYALSNIQVGDKDGEIREIPYGEKVTGITRSRTSRSGLRKLRPLGPRLKPSSRSKPAHSDVVPSDH
jgi:hypothetical protein